MIKELDKELNNEWILTNSLGSYAYSNELCCNTSKYQGLLIATTKDFIQRHLILSRVDESIEINKKKYNLYSNINSDGTMEKSSYLKCFNCSCIADFKYEVQDVKIEKSICMQENENTVCIRYKIKCAKENVKINITPIMNFRDLHKKNQYDLNFSQEEINNKVKIKINGNISTPVYFYVKDGRYNLYEKNIFNNMYYVKEKITENHIVPGTYTITINALEEKEINFICSLNDNIEKLNVDKVFNGQEKKLEEEISRCRKSLKISEKALKNYCLYKNKLTIYKQKQGINVLIAGFPYYLEDGRALSMSVEGLSLISKDSKLAKNSVISLLQEIKNGIVPNSYSGFDGRAIYNNLETPLLIFDIVDKIYKYDNKIEFIKDVYNNLEEIIFNYITGIKVDDCEVFLNEKFILEISENAKYNDFETIQLDFNEKLKNNIQALWYNAIMVMVDLSKKIKGKEDAKKYSEIAEKLKENYIQSNSIDDIMSMYSETLKYSINNYSEDSIMNALKKINIQELFETPVKLQVYYTILENVLLKTKSEKNKKQILNMIKELLRFINKIIDEDKIPIYETYINSNASGAILYAPNIASIYTILIRGRKYYDC